MNPAIDYLVRKDLAKDTLKIPCSIFLFNKDDLSKLVLTITEEFNKTDFYSVKHWYVELCSSEQALPPMTEFRIKKNNFFTNEKIRTGLIVIIIFLIC